MTVALALPFRGTWLVRNSPARRVPSHGTHLFATTYAIDFVAVRDRTTAPTWDWRTLLATEPPGRFLAFGRPILAPAPAQVVAVHDGEPDHEVRRSPPALLGYALTQASRARGGAHALAGNHVILAVAGGFVVLAHLRAGSIQVRPGAHVDTGRPIGACGNSGNSTCTSRPWTPPTPGPPAACRSPSAPTSSTPGAVAHRPRSPRASPPTPTSWNPAEDSFFVVQRPRS